MSEMKDEDAISGMMKDEGYAIKDMDIKRSATWVIDENKVKGFFSFRLEHDLPYLVHLCVKKEYRSPSFIWKMAMYFKEIVKLYGYNKALMNTPKGDNYLSQLVSRYFKVRPYAANNEVQFYLVEV